MKSYKKATLVAKSARCGSYAAGCPEKYGGRGVVGADYCSNCQLAV